MKRKNKNKNIAFHRIWDMTKPHIKSIIIIVLIAIVINVLELARPYLVKVVIDDFLNKGIYEKGIITLSMIGFIYIGMVLLSNVLDMITRTATGIMGENVVQSLRNRLFRFVQYANVTFHDKTSTGKIFVRITNDVEDIATLFKDVITTSIKDIILILGIAGMMIYFGFQLSMLSFVVLPFCIITVYLISKTLKKLYNIAKNIRTQLNTFLAESIYGIKLIKVFNRQKEKARECNKYTREYFNARRPTGILEGILPAAIEIFKNISIVIVIVACVNRWFGIQLDVGLVYIFITYIGNLFEPISRLIDNMEVVQESLVSIDKIYEILDLQEYQEDLGDGKYLSQLKGKIEFKHVWFAYEKNNYVLKDVSFTIEPHQSVALVGKTGSGKTTITNLINRFYDVDKGEILIDGININKISKRSLRRRIGTILQDPFIFAKSIKDNVKLYRDISDASVEKVLRLSSANNFVSKLPKGMEEIASENGESFSIGQKQLLSFARIFAHDPSIFILDEATANIDTTTENQIQRAIDIISKEKTSIFIAHRLSTIVNVDKIIVLNRGKIIETGSHDELVQQGGYYSKLYNAYYVSLG